MRKRSHSTQVRDQTRQEPGRLLLSPLHNSTGRIAGSTAVGSSIGYKPRIGRNCTLRPDRRLQLHRLLLAWPHVPVDALPNLLEEHGMLGEEEVQRAMEGWVVLQLTLGVMVVEGEVVRSEHIAADRSCNVAMTAVDTVVLDGVDSVDVGCHHDDSSKVV